MIDSGRFSPTRHDAEDASEEHFAAADDLPPLARGKPAGGEETGRSALFDLGQIDVRWDSAFGGIGQSYLFKQRKKLQTAEKS